MNGIVLYTVDAECQRPEGQQANDQQQQIIFVMDIVLLVGNKLPHVVAGWIGEYKIDNIFGYWIIGN